ncbi:MAG: hypothetical protein CME65_13670 [Halobacteriovoraceae bacterium]|nr:hypothetical protein [Halobacteriovoraceae bacterium]|tara:strand:+ start:4485 stop:5009 length:525 start_codon:yes stop_codon:yes gene_type:complete
MAQRKLIELNNTSFNKGEFSQIWREYFSDLSLELSRVLEPYFNEDVTVRYLHRNVLFLEEYLHTTSKGSIFHPFKIIPSQDIGFLFLSGDELNLVRALDDMTRLVERHLSKKETRQADKLRLESLPIGQLKVMEIGFQAQAMLSIQQFLVVIGKETHILDLAFSHRFLEGRALI